MARNPLLISSAPISARNPLLGPREANGRANPSDPIGPIVLRRRPSSVTKKTARILRSRTAAAMLEDWQPGAPLAVATRGQVSLSDVVVAAADKLGAPHCILSAWCGAPEHFDFMLAAKAAGRFASLSIILDSLIQGRDPEAVSILRRELGPERLAITRSRARFALLWKDEARLSIVSTADLTRNIGLELHLFDPDPALFEFLADLARDIFAAHGTPAETAAGITAQFNTLNE